MTQNPATLEFLRQRFREYYLKAPLQMPDTLERREWGFVHFSSERGGFKMNRHIGLSTREDVVEYLQQLVPKHAYYSTAYYTRPDAATMDDKGWAGADLIFDLDGDTLKETTYETILIRVKEETLKLLDMLVSEIGIEPRSIEIVFSGSRGYHVHVKESAIRRWGSEERREIIEYVSGIGIEPAAMFTPHTPPERSWQRRYRDALREYLTTLGEIPESDALGQLTALEGVGVESALRFLREREEIIRLITEEPTPDLLRGRVLLAILTHEKSGFRDHLLRRAAHTDNPVTTDIKRLIRMPTSLHGSSGLKVSPLELRQVQDFDPLSDAVVFGTRDIAVDVSVGGSHQILGSRYDIQKGRARIPEAVAVFLCARGMAQIA